MLPNESQDAMALALSLDLAPTVAPDEAAANEVLANRYHLPVAMVEQYHADYKKQAWYEDAVTTTRKSPVLQTFLRDETRAKIMQDDLPNLAQTERVATSLPHREDRVEDRGLFGTPGPGVIRNTPSLTPTLGNVLTSLGVFAQHSWKAAAEGARQEFGEILGDKELVRDATRKAAQSQAAYLAGRPEFDNWVARDIQSGFESLTLMIPELAIGMATGSGAVPLGILGVRTQAQRYGEYREKGVPIPAALLASFEDAGIEVLTEKMTLDFMLKHLGKGPMKALISGYLVREVGSEIAADIGQSAVETAALHTVDGGPQKTWKQFLLERPESAVHTAVASLVAVGTIGAIHAGVQKLAAPETQAKEAERFTATIHALSELSAASKVRPRPGQTFSDYIESVTDGTPVQEVALSPLALQQSGQAEEAMNLSPSIRAQYESALTLGTDMVIPTAEYLSTIAPTELGGLLLDDLKVPGESMTRKEAREYVAQQSATFDAVIATQVSEHLTRADLDASSRVVGQQILTQLQQTTRYTKEQAKDLSVLIRSFYDTTALKAGMTPEALFTQIPYSVQGAGTPSTGTLTQPAFAEANYRPEVSAWAKKQFGNRTAPNNSAVWQNFTQWFGDSKVVDKAGKPLVVYHGTFSDFTEFKPEFIGRTGMPDTKVGDVYFFTTNKLTGATAAASDAQGNMRGELPKFMNVFLSLQNPVEYDPSKWGEPDVIDTDKMANAIRLAKEGGRDGVIFRSKNMGDTYVVFSPTQIKSSIDNNGDFDSTDQSILNQPARDRSVDEIHAFATANQIAWDDDPAFMDFTESVTGKRKIDALTQPERNRLYAALESRVGAGRIMRGMQEGGNLWARTMYYRKRAVPDGWYVHGRAGQQTLGTGRGIFLSQSIAVADFYAGANGSVWFIRPKEGVSVFDLSDEYSPDMQRVVDAALRDFNSGDLPFLKDIESTLGGSADESDIENAVRSTFAPVDIVDSGEGFDAANWKNWFQMNFPSVAFVKTPNEGGIAYSRDSIDAVKATFTEEKDWTQHEPTVTSTGKINGAPDWVKTTRQKTKMRQMLRQFVQEGLAGRYWYEQSARGIMTLVGGNVRLAEKFIQLIAVYSPNSNVWGNTLSAVKAFTHWKMGRSAETFKVGMPEHDKNAVAILYQNASWDGRKTNSFYLNLMYEIIQTYPEQVAQLNLPSDLTEALAHTSTIDVWMARAFGYVREQFGDDKGEGRYSFAENEVRRLTAELNRDRAPGEAAWLPHQVQAAIWTAMKTRYELADVKAQTNAKGFKDKILTVDQDGKTIYPADTAKDRAQRNQHYANWRAFALKASPERVIAAANATSRSFADELQRMTETVTFEALPTASHNHEVNRASLAAREAFTAEARALLMGADGQDLLAKWLGIALQYSTNGYGGFEKNISPVILAHLLPKRTTGQKGFSVDEVRLYARAVQYIMMQDAVPWFRPDNKVLTSQAAIQAQKFRVLDTASKRTVKTFDTQDDATAFAAQKGEGFAVQGGELSTAVTFRFTSALTQPMLTEFFSTLQSYLGPTAGFTRTAVNEIMVANFRDDETKVPIDRTDEDFLDRKESLIKDHGVRLGVESHINFWIQGEYGNVHDWSNDIQGDRILREVGLSGRPDLHPWLHDRRADYEGLLSRYSGDSLARIERDLASDRLLQQAAVNPLLQQASVSTFYSHALNVLEDKMPARASVEQIRGILSPENGVKADELKWLGLDLFLQTQAQFTKDEVLAFVRENQVQVEEVEKGEDKVHQAALAAYEAAVAPIWAARNAAVRTTEAAYDAAVRTAWAAYEAAVAPARAARNAAVLTALAAYGAAYDAAVLTALAAYNAAKATAEAARDAAINTTWAAYNAAKAPAQAAYNAAAGPAIAASRKNGPTKFSSYQLPGGTNYGELLLTFPAQKDTFTKHWNESNVLAHVRFNDRKGPKGEKVLFLEEVQSDWHQTGRDEGYKSAGTLSRDEASDILSQVAATYDAAREAARVVYNAATASDQATYDAAKTTFWAVRNVDAAQAAYKAAIAPARAAFEAATAPAQDAYDAAIATAKAAYDTARVPAEAAYAESGLVPDAPFKKTWHELAMKRILRYAAEHGYDTLAWTVGSQQIERYESDLRQNVDAIGWDATRVWALKNKQEVFTGEVDAKTGRFTSGDADGKLISEVLGKSMAEKIAASPTGTLSGDGLSVGGEGMKFFYDQQLPNFVKTYTKKWGATVSDLKLEKIDTPVHAVDITAPMRESVLQVGQRLFQTDQGTGPRGAFDPATLKTLLYEKADVSTVWHEMMHFYVEALMQVGTLPNATPQMQADVQALMELFQLPNAQAWAGLTAEQQRPHHEAFAYLGEIYLWEGKAPSSALRAAFERLALFMRQIYRAIRDELNGLYRQQFGIDLPMLTPEVRKVFDRMLVADEQIREAEEIMKLLPLFQTQAQAKMSDAEWLAYKDLAQAAQQESISALTTASLKQMQWLSNAQSKYLKAQQAQHEALRTAIRREVADALPNEPIYRALQWLKTGFIRGADGQEIQATDGFKLDRAALEEMYPTDDGRVDTDRLDWSAIKTLTKEGGLHPDVVAEMFGFPSGDHLVRTLLATPTIDEAITARTDEQMLREHSELTNPAAMKLAMDTALHTEARARLVAVELRHAAKATKPVRLLTAAAKQAAERFLQTQRIKDIHASRYATAERQAGARAEKAMKTGDGAAVTLALQQRLLNNQFVQQAAGIQEEVAAGLRYAKALQTDAAKKRMGADYADQIDALLEQFELGPMTLKAMAARTSLAQWAAQQEAKGFAPDLSPDLLAETRRVPYKMLTVGSFRELIAALKQIDHMGTNAQFLLTAAKTTAYVEARDLIIASINEHAQGRTAEARTPTTKIGRMVHGLKQFAASHLKAATIARVLDGGIDGGPVWEYLIRTANIRGNQETQMTAEATTAITKILAPFLSKPMGGKGRVFPSVQRSFNRESLLAIALNTGNNGNMQRLLGGEGWTRGQITPLLQSLTAAEWRAVQEIWDHFESYTPQIAAKQRKLYGQEPDWITPVPFTVQTSDGQQVELRGGYYPIKYDPQASIQAETQADADAAAAQLRGAYTSATTRRSFTKARVEAVTGRPLIYTLSGLYGGVGEIIHDLAWHEWLIDANRLLRSSGIDQAIRTQYGPAWKAQLKSWIEDVATGNRGVQQAGEQALSRLRQGVSAAGIGFNLMSAALQITGFNQSIVRIGAGWTARGIAKVLVSPFEIAQEVNAKSTFMAHRAMTQFRELNEVKNRVEGDSGTLRTIHAGTYFAMMRMQRMVDVPTWWGAYEKGLAMGGDEDTAIALADQAVIDSQGSGMVKDLSAVERGGPAMKLFTVFYAYMNTVFQMGTTSTMTATGKGKLTADYIMLGIVPVVLAMALKAALRPGDDEEWDWEKLAKQLAAEELSYLMGTMIVVREFQEAAKIVTGAEGAGRDYSGPAGIRIVADAVKFMKQASQGEFDTAFRKAAINLLGDMAGLPAAQVNRTIDGFEALTEGKTENPFALVMGYQTKR